MNAQKPVGQCGPIAAERENEATLTEREKTTQKAKSPLVVPPPMSTIMLLAGSVIEWMRVNPLVCVQADEVMSPQHWVSVVVFGRYEELPHTPEWQREREFAWKLLQQHAM